MSYFTLESHDTLLFCHLTAFLFHKSINTLLPTFPSLPNQISFLSLKSLNFLYLIMIIFNALNIREDSMKSIMMKYVDQGR